MVFVINVLSSRGRDGLASKGRHRELLLVCSGTWIEDRGKERNEFDSELKYME
jgi:hypothetical protein